MKIPQLHMYIHTAEDETNARNWMWYLISELMIRLCSNDKYPVQCTDEWIDGN